MKDYLHSDSFSQYMDQLAKTNEELIQAYIEDSPERMESRGITQTGTREMSPIMFHEVREESKELKKLCPEHIAALLGVDVSLVLNKSTSSKGIIGFLNNRARKMREKKYRKRVKKDPSLIRIVSEGDSWFQFPVYVKDLIDWISKEKDLAVYSLGAGGDWIYNILHEREYHKALEEAGNPEFFLISGGGNDLLQDERITELVHDYNPTFEQNPELYIKENLGHLITVFEFLYIQLYSELEDRYPNLKILCHGYDYAYPTDAIGFHPIKGLLRKLGGNGQWLKKPFENRLNIKNPHTQHAIVKLVIDRINVMHEKMSAAFDNVYYVNLRGFAPQPENWHDEIHPSSQNFKVMADQYIGRIKALSDLKV